jgi:hypothetical protein
LQAIFNRDSRHESLLQVDWPSLKQISDGQSTWSTAR